MSGVFQRLERAWARRNVPAGAGPAPDDSRRDVVLITGASEGIGMALSREFAAAGHDLALVARSPDRLEECARQLRDGHGVTVDCIHADLVQTGACDRLAAELKARGLRVDVLVNNAAIGLSGPFAGHAHADVLRLADLNMRVLSDLMHRYLPEMLSRADGGILNVASLGGSLPGPYQAAYYASKAYVISLTEAVAHEIGGRGTRLSVVVPGPVATRFHARMGAESALYTKVFGCMDPDIVARAAYRGYRCRKVLILPGILTTFNYFAVRILPHTLTTPLMGALLKKRRFLRP
ncbi:MAG: SDR family NAD(P)-dependent oxidoreductase [Dichotomicrobium sp.]